MRKFLTLFLVVILAVGSTFAVFADDTDKVVKEEEKILKEQNKSLDKYDKLIEKVNDLKDNGKEKKYDDNFGGVYLDENQRLVVSAIDVVEMRALLEMDDVEYKEVKTSIKTLEKSMKDIEKLDTGLYVSASLQIADNRILVRVNPEKRVDLETAISKKKIKNITIEETVLTNSFTATSIINGNYAQPEENLLANITVGIAVRDASSNDPGVLIPGHINQTGAGVGSDIYYNNEIMGSIDKLQLSGSVDAAFVNTNKLFSDSHIPTYDFMNGDYYVSASYSSSYVIEGLYVNLYGGTSGKTAGYITSISSTSMGLTDLIESDSKAIGGDSGGAVKFERYVGSASTVPTVISTQSSSILFDKKWVPGSSRSYSSKISNIFSALNLKNY